MVETEAYSRVPRSTISPSEEETGFEYERILLGQVWSSSYRLFEDVPRRFQILLKNHSRIADVCRRVLGKLVLAGEMHAKKKLCNSTIYRWNDARSLRCLGRIVK